jgi:hypothetical protein
MASNTPGAMPVPAMAPLLLMIILGACDNASAGDRWSIDELPRLGAEPTLRIGDVNDPDAGFSSIAYVDVDRDGNIYVGEGLDVEIRVYSPEGELLRRIGRRGEGPGEFDGLPRFGVQGDTVWAYDNGLRRITLFDREGAVLETALAQEVQVPLPGGYGWVMPWALNTDGSFSSDMMRLSYYRRDEDHPQVEHSPSIPVPRVRFALDGTVLDTVGWDPSPNPRMYSPPTPEREARYQRIEIGGRNFSVPDPPPALPHWYTLHNGRLILEMDVATAPGQGTFILTRFDLDGDTTFRREYHYTPTPWSGEALDSIAARAARGAPGGGVPYSPGHESVPHNVQVVQNRLRDAMKFPAFQQPIGYGWVDQDERLWLSRAMPEGEPPVFIVIGTDGTVLGEIGLPGGTRLWYAKGDIVWVSQPDDLDVPWLVSYRIGGLGDFADR